MRFEQKTFTIHLKLRVKKEIKKNTIQMRSASRRLDQKMLTSAVDSMADELLSELDAFMSF